MAVAGDTGYLASGLLEIIAADAIVVLGNAGVTRNLIRTESRPHGDTISIQVYNGGTHQGTRADVGAVTDGAEIAATLIGSEKKTMTMVMQAIRSDVYDDTKNSSQDDPTGPVGQILGQAMSDDIDYTINALFDGFSNAVGSSTVGLTVDNLYSAFTILKTGKAKGIYQAVLDPRQITGTYGLLNDIATSAQFGGSPDIQNEALKNAFVQKIAGIQVYESDQFAVNSKAVKGGVFTRDALAWGWTGSQMIKVETERQASYLRDLYVISSFYGAIETHDGYGVEIHTKVTA